MKTLYALSLAFGLAVGCTFGIWYGRLLTNGGWMLNEMFASSAASNYAFLQYKLADIQHAREALAFSTQFLDDIDVIEPQRGHKFDAALSYGRLALLEEAEGNREQSRAYFARAQERFKAAGKDKNDCNEAQVREIVRKLDQL